MTNHPNRNWRNHWKFLANGVWLHRSGFAFRASLRPGELQWYNSCSTLEPSKELKKQAGLLLAESDPIWANL